ncbi:MAG TPA: hypothetical protein VFG43_04965 [Geminicoccaceae bacterium]|nr:hypothetical protein [Geminicoccaceae bacterium]
MFSGSHSVFMGAFVLALLAGAEARANTLTGTLGRVDYSVNCPAGCALLDAVPGRVIRTPSEQDLAAHLNLLLPGAGFGKEDVTKYAGGNPPLTFPVWEPYFIMKISGPNAGYLFFRNNGGTQRVGYSATGTALGLSFYAQAVPLPTALLLLLTALGGLLAWRRRSGPGENPAARPA